PSRLASVVRAALRAPTSPVRLRILAGLPIVVAGRSGSVLSWARPACHGTPGGSTPHPRPALHDSDVTLCCARPRGPKSRGLSHTHHLERTTDVDRRSARGGSYGGLDRSARHDVGARPRLRADHA